MRRHKTAYISKLTFLYNHHFSGGVDNCGPEVQKEYTFEEGSQNMELTLCGHPQPTLQHTFKGKTKEAEMIEKVDNTKKMYKYRINLDNIDREDCGSTLTLNAIGFKNWYNSSTIKIKCKNSQNLLYLHSYVTCYDQILIRLLQTYS